MKAWLAATAIVLVLGGVAHASAADDGNAALDALNAGDNDRAVQLFTRAIESHELSAADQEFALANRGRAYAKEGQVALAIDDLDQARRLKPDDADAQKDLVALLQARLPADQIPGLPRAGFWQSLGQALLQGAASGLAAGLSGDGNQ
jgi:tetratricopeptide (TPR) repeat protein